MKKILGKLLVLSAIFALSSCGETPVSSSSHQGGETSSVAPSSSNAGASSSTSAATAADLGEAMAATPYASAELPDVACGLSDAASVGVKAEDSSLIPEKEDGSYTHVISVAEMSLAEIRQYMGEAAVDNGYYKLAAAFAKAKALSNGTDTIKISLPSGTLDIDCGYVSSSRVIEADGLQNVDIVGHDTRINIQYKDLEWKGFLTLTNSSNVTLCGIKLDAEVPSSLVGTISTMSVEKKTCTVKVDPSSYPLVKQLEAKGGAKALCEYLEFDAKTNAPLQGGNFFDRGSFEGYEIQGNETDGYTIVVSFSSAITRSKNGSKVVLAYSEYDVSLVSMENCVDVTFEDVDAYHACGMGFVASNGTNLHLNRVNLKVEEGSASLMTATADGMHFSEMHGSVEVTNSIIEYTHDDALNIKHGYWYRVASADNQTKTLSLVKLTGSVSTPKEGMKVAVYNDETFVGHNPTSGYYTIDSVKVTASGYDLTVKERMSGVIDWGSCRATILTDTPNFVFRNNIVRNKRNRGVLVQVPGAIIENNTFQRVGHGSIQAASAMDTFNECTLPQDLTIRNNKFIDNLYLQPEPLYGDVSVFAIASNASVAPKGTVTNAKVENNFFTGNGNAAICFRGVGSSSIAHNYFYECCALQVSGEQFNCLFSAYNTDSTSLTDNYSYYTRDKGMSGIYLQGLSREADFTLSGNTGIEFYRSSQVGPDEDVSKATGAIAYDGDLSDWEGIGATDIELIGASQATGDEVNASDLEDHFKVKEAKITHTDEGIAMAFDVYDAVLDVKPAASFWTGDCIEILATTILDMPSADTQVYKEDGGVLQVAFAPTWTASNYCSIASVRSNTAYTHHESDLKVGSVTRSDGYTMEFCLPYSLFPEFKTAIDAGNRIGMAIVVADSERDDLGYKRVQIGNVPHFVETYKTKSEMMPRYLFK